MKETLPATRCGNTEFRWGEKTYVMGICNLSPDSFSGDGLGDDIEATVAYFSQGVAELCGAIPDLVASTSKKSIDRQVRKLVDEKMPEELAMRIATFNELFSALDIVEAANEIGKSVEEVAAMYFALGQRLDLEIRWIAGRVIVHVPGGLGGCSRGSWKSERSGR